MKYKNIIFFILLIVLGIILISYVWSPPQNNGIILLSDGDTVPKSICDNIINKSIIIHRAGCSACAVALPRLEEIEQELGIEIKYYDMAVEEERNELLSMNFTTQYVPALISKCKVYIGAKQEEEYIEILKNG